MYSPPPLKKRYMDNGELGKITNCTNCITSQKSFKKLELQELGGWNTYSQQANSTVAEN